MRILTLSNCPLVATLGSGYVITGFCERLRARGHHVDCYGPESFEPLPSLAGRAKSYRQALGMLAFCLRRMRHARRQRALYDVVEFYGGESWLAASVLSAVPRRPFLLVSHSNGLETHHGEATRAHQSGSGSASKTTRRWYHLDQSRWMKLAFTRVDGIVTVSQNDADYALRHGYQPSDRIVAIENSLPESFLRLPVEFARAPTIAFCGSWLENKGTAAMSSALNALLAEMPRCRLCLVGVGAEFRKEEHFFRASSQVDVIPFVESKDELRRLYQSFSIVMLPSIYESFGLAGAEAMACGCALIASRTGFAAGLRHGEEAWILEHGTPEALRQALLLLLQNEAVRIKIARGGYERVQRLRWDDAVATLESTYHLWANQRNCRNYTSVV